MSGELPSELPIILDSDLIKSEDRIATTRIPNVDQDVVGGQPEDGPTDLTIGLSFLDILCTLKWLKDNRLDLNKNLSELADKALSRDNLGLGTSAIRDIVNSLGNSTTKLVDQKTITDALGTKFNKSNLVGSLGNDTDKGIHQKKISQEIANLLRKDDNLAGLTNKAVARENLGWIWPLGVNQTWVDVFNSRSLGVTYTNTTGRPIMVIPSIRDPDRGNLIYDFYVDGVRIALEYLGKNMIGVISVVIPNGSTYMVDGDSNDFIYLWWELR